jgi:SAM-dependent methyltransferase
MKLSSIVKYKNLLDTLGSGPAAEELYHKIIGMINLFESSEVQIPGCIDQLKSTHQLIQQTHDQFEQQFAQLKQAVQNLIEQHEPEYFQNSLELFNHGYRNDTPELTRDRRLGMDVGTFEIIKQRLQLYANWQSPGMVLRPAHEHVTNLVACDPMYFVDTSTEMLDLTQPWFTPAYQNRLRRYVIDEYRDQPFFENLPKQCFGLIYSFHFLNYRPWTVLQRYLKECFDLLRPGGIMFFTYNNCDIANRVVMVEHYSGCYTPGRLIKNYVAQLGYETLHTFDDASGTSWMELRRPGNYTSIRGGQTLAAILQRSND